jgi:ferritin-like metal-binding protein YciE
MTPPTEEAAGAESGMKSLTDLACAAQLHEALDALKQTLTEEKDTDKKLAGLAPQLGEKLRRMSAAAG